MQRQCAGCATVYEDGQEPLGPNEHGPRPYGCCEECNKHTFRSNEQPSIATIAPDDAVAELAKVDDEDPA